MNELAYSKTPEQEFEENLNALVAEGYIKKTYGVNVTTDYAYRNTFDILVDLGNYLVNVKKVNYRDYVDLAAPANVEAEVI